MIEHFKSKKHILDILTKVNREVKHKEGRNEKGHLVKMHPTCQLEIETYIETEREKKENSEREREIGRET